MTLRISGKTYDYRDLLTTYGARFDGATKTWLIDDQRWETLLERNSNGSNKRDRERAAAVTSWTVEPVVEDARLAAIDEIKALMARHSITVEDLR